MKVWLGCPVAQFSPTFKVHLRPGLNEVPDQMAEALIAAGIVARAEPGASVEVERGVDLSFDAPEAESPGAQIEELAPLRRRRRRKDSESEHSQEESNGRD